MVPAAVPRNGSPPKSRSLVETLPCGHRHICYSRPAPGDVQGRDYQTAGRLSLDVLTALVLPRDADAYLCGPAAFMAEASAALVGLGIDGTRIRTEIFGAAPPLTPGIAPAAARPPHAPAGEPGGGPHVAFTRSGLLVRWDDAYAILLELAEACDVPVRWSCRTGVCHTCETALLSGSVSYAPDPVDDPADGSPLICCSRPQGDLTNDGTSAGPEPTGTCWCRSLFATGWPSQGIQISLGVQPVLPLFIEDDQQALTHRVAAGFWPAGPLDRNGVAIQRLIRQLLDDMPYRGHPLTAQLEHLVKRGSRVAVAAHSRRVRHLVPREVQGMPR
jgi:ferredoxin